jgi:hypothetical protein
LFDSSQRCPEKVYPDSFNPKEAKWHILDGGLASAGTLVILSLRVVHAAVPNETDDLRFSWDARFRLRVKDDRGIEYGELPGNEINQGNWS